jgi:hypothetical protein
VEVEMLEKAQGLEEQLREWQAERARKGEGGVTPPIAARDRRTVRINGREVEIVRKPRRAL